MAVEERACVVDVETTGLSPDVDRVVEFAAVEIVGRRLTGKRLHILINPEREIPPEVTAIHGITNDRVASEPVFAACAPAILEFLRGAEFVAHNASFDVGMLTAEFSRLVPAAEFPSTKVTDTLDLSRRRWPGQRQSLDAVCDRLGVDRSRRHKHGAMIDAELLAEVFLAMHRGQSTLFGDGGAERRSARFIDLLGDPGGPLPVIQATPEEVALHEQRLQVLAKKSGIERSWPADPEKLVEP